jgi:beta-galactosidase
LTDYNRIVGVNHMIRPFRRERVTFPARKNPLTAGLSNADITLSSGERINGFTDDVYMASDVFSYVVDYDDVAPFAKLPESSYWGYGDSSNDHNPYNIVNGFNSSDSWQLIFSIWAGTGGKLQVPLSLPQEQTLTEVEWQGNAFYYPTKQFEISTESGNKAVFQPTPNNEPQTFAIRPPLTGRDFMLKITGWVPAKEPPIVGIDNLRLKAQRSPAFYQTVHPLLNIGAMMRYDRGIGGMVLCNLLFQDVEAVPENKRKKQNILATLLRNLKAPVGGATTVIAGSALAYSPIDIGRFSTQFRDEQGWFGDRQFTFKDMPTGRQTFAGVPFSVYQFATSPVPNAVMLKGDGIPGNLPEAVRGIAVGKKADALFFLQTARMDVRRNEQEVREKKRYEMARYVVHYADGQQVTVPVVAEEDIDDYRRERPQALPGAQVGWVKKYEGTPYTAVAYVMQWNNPRPDVAIQSIDLEYGSERRGVPVLLALTAASVGNGNRPIPGRANRP